MSHLFCMAEGSNKMYKNTYICFEKDFLPRNVKTLNVESVILGRENHM